MKELTVEAIVEQIETVTEFVNAELEKLDCPMKARIQLDIAIDEIVSNIAYYAYGEKTGTVTVKIEALQEENGVQLMFLDSGVPYDPLTRTGSGYFCRDRRTGRGRTWNLSCP